jgi:hypothetical protein
MEVGWGNLDQPSSWRTTGVDLAITTVTVKLKLINPPTGICEGRDAVT